VFKTDHPLTQDQRCQVYALKKSGLSQTDIAIEIGASPGTPSREPTRNKGLHGYRFFEGAPSSDAPVLTAQKSVTKASIGISGLTSAQAECSIYSCDNGAKRHKREHNCPPDHSRDCDLNQKTNGLVRPNCPKGTDFS